METHILTNPVLDPRLRSLRLDTYAFSRHARGVGDRVCERAAVWSTFNESSKKKKTANTSGSGHISTLLLYLLYSPKGCAQAAKIFWKLNTISGTLRHHYSAQVGPKNTPEISCFRRADELSLAHFASLST